MADVAFLGLGNMGLRMAVNLAKAGHEVRGYDLNPQAMSAAERQGVTPARSVVDAVKQSKIVITMLPAGPQAREAYLGEGGVLAAAGAGTLLIDCSTIDVATARDLAGAAEARGLAMLDAPVSGGVGGAEAGTLTFMVGGDGGAFEQARPFLNVMGKKIVHCGGPGTGQAAKICNNMMLGIQMLSVCEAFALAEKLGLDNDKLFEVASSSSGQCWSLTTYCPVPGPVPTSPANRDYQAGFTVAMMLKDLALAQSAATEAGLPTPTGAQAHQMYRLFAQGENAGLDFSAIIGMMSGKRS